MLVNMASLVKQKKGHDVKHGVESGVFFGVEFGVSFGVDFKFNIAHI